MANIGEKNIRITQEYDRRMTRDAQLSGDRASYFGMLAYAALLRGTEKRRQRLSKGAKVA